MITDDADNSGDVVGWKRESNAEPLKSPYLAEGILFEINTRGRK